MAAPPSGQTHPEIIDYAIASISMSLPDVQAHFTQTWRPQPKTIKNMARRLANRWNKATSQQIPAQHNTTAHHDASIQQDASNHDDASISHTTQQHTPVQLSFPVVQASAIPIHSKMPVPIKTCSPAPTSLKQEGVPATLKQEEESK
ncbi:hypothetical protein M436DRAFT_84402 [Aureobasidium namibiae CBS 147.97]|uniref:Uncharacterized protein n=1 Tax=Aureobasidium namibiae CBS 147.97 TaxID=1043004 RepID=A0A074WGT4_9PEZI